jgi:thioredoxin reductase
MNEFDCIVVGGGAAGLAASMVLVRARRRVLMIDAGRQNNLRTTHAGGVFLHDGESPADLYARGLEQLRKYPTFTYRRDTVSSVAAVDSGFEVSTSSTTGTGSTALSVVLAQGVEFAASPIPGADALWGTTVVNCPFCDGWESRDLRVLAIGSEQWMSHMTSMLPLWIDDLTWADSASIAALTGARLESDSAGGQGEARADSAGGLTATFTDGSTAHFGRAFVEQSFVERTEFTDHLGCARTPEGALVLDAMGQTSVPGVFAAGDQASAQMQVNIAVASGHTAGVGVVRALLGM